MKIKSFKSSKALEPSYEYSRKGDDRSPATEALMLKPSSAYQSHSYHNELPGPSVPAGDSRGVLCGLFHQ